MPNRSCCWRLQEESYLTRFALIRYFQCAYSFHSQLLLYTAFLCYISGLSCGDPSRVASSMQLPPTDAASCRDGPYTRSTLASRAIAHPPPYPSPPAFSSSDQDRNQDSIRAPCVWCNMQLKTTVAYGVKLYKYY